MSIDLSKKYAFIDFTSLVDIIGDDEDTLHEIISEFLTVSPKDIENLVEAVNAHNYPAVIASAHKLKATFRYFGISSTEQLVSIELGAKENVSIDKITVLLEEVLIGYNGALQEVKQFLL
jgi:HPt (histidine-containing phosphotransfer) domain-containing protein